MESVRCYSCGRLLEEKEVRVAAIGIRGQNETVCPKCKKRAINMEVLLILGVVVALSLGCWLMYIKTH